MAEILASNSKQPEDEFAAVSVGVKSAGEIRKIIVDRTACIGARSCVLVAEKTFQVDEENLAYVTADETQYEDDETLKLAAQSCPVLAIHLYNKSGKKIFPEAPS